jgi:hypothetical protein
LPEAMRRQKKNRKELFNKLSSLTIELKITVVYIYNTYNVDETGLTVVNKSAQLRLQKDAKRW